MTSIMADEVAETAWEVTIIRECSLCIDVLIFCNFMASLPLYSRISNADSFFLCSIFTLSLAYNQRDIYIYSNSI